MYSVDLMFLGHHHKTRIVCSEEKIDKTVKQSKNLIDTILSYIVIVSYMSGVTLSEILEECGVAAEQYGNALRCVEKRSLYINKNNVK